MWIAKQRTFFIRLFWLVNILLVILIAFGYRAIVLGAGDPFFYFALGRKAADMAVLFLVAASIPGIARRFRIRHKLIMLLMLFRRQVGVTAFFFALVHVCFVTLFPVVRFHLPLIATDLQSLAGWGTFTLLLPLFLTSNDISVRRLGIWWHKIHALVYGAIFVLVAHTFFSEESWFFLISVAAIAELASYVYGRIRKR